MREWGKPLSGTALSCTFLHFSCTFPSFFPYICIFYFSSQPDGSPDYVTSVSVSEPAMRLPPVYVDSQTYSSDGSPDYVTFVSVSEPAMLLPPVHVDGQTMKL